MNDLFRHPQYLIRRKILTFLGAKLQVFDPTGQPILFSKHKAFKLREDIRVYSDETQTDERLLIKARQVIDFSAAYDVVDSKENKKVGALRRKGLTSILRDTWEFLDPNDRPIGKILEDSTGLALIRRFLTNLIPQTYYAQTNGTRLATLKQNFNPFVYKLSVTLHPGAKETVDPRLILAGGILLAAVEGKQG